MEKIIEKLYEIHLNEEQYPFGIVDKESIQKEYDLYFFLSQTLSGDDKEHFSEYANLNDERHKMELKAMYEYGFKTAVKLFLETIKE